MTSTIPRALPEIGSREQIANRDMNRVGDDLLQEYWDAEFAAAYQRARAAVDGFFEYLKPTDTNERL